MNIKKIPTRELEWLLYCTDLQMGDGDTARKLIDIWLSGQSAIDVINEKQRMLGMDEL